MAETIEKVSAALFDKLRSRFEGLSVGDETAASTQDPNNARFFNFNYLDKSGKEFGNITITLLDDTLKIIYGKNITANLNSTEKREWADFLRDMRLFAMRNQLQFTPQDISKSSLRIKDLKQTAAANVQESALYGTAKTSYKKMGEGYRLIVKHTGPIDEGTRGARSRKINSVYVETPDGERFKMPFNHLPACEALARHVSKKGKISDKFSKHIVELVSEMASLKNFIRGARNKTFEDAEANDMVDAAKDRYQTIRTVIHKMRSPKGFEFYKSSWKPSKTLQDDIDLEELKGKFVQKSFDDRLDAALPHVFAAYNALKNSAPEKQINEFEDWADSITEGTWALPTSDEQIKALQQLMVEPVLAGVDSENAIGALYDILGDDDLFDRIYDASRSSPDLDVRPIILDWLKNQMPELHTKVTANAEVAGLEVEPVPTPPKPEPEPEPESSKEEEPESEEEPEEKEDLMSPDDVASKMPPVDKNESIDLSRLKYLAGIR